MSLITSLSEMWIYCFYKHKTWFYECRSQREDKQVYHGCCWSLNETKIHFVICYLCTGASLVAQMVKNLPAMWESWVQSLDCEAPLEKVNGYPLQYSGLENSVDREAWWSTKFMESQRVRDDWVTSTVSFIYAKDIMYPMQLILILLLESKNITSPQPLHVCSNSCPLSQWCHPVISSSVTRSSSWPVFPSISVFSYELALCIR